MSKYQEIIVEISNKLAVIKLNRPKKLNAINPTMYVEVTSALKEISNNDDVSITVVTGVGDFYCAGTDLRTSINMDSGDMNSAILEANSRVKAFIAAFIDHEKVLVGVVNGPAVGIAVTTLALFDIVYCSDNATFQTPFTSLGLSSEGCSSYTFPLIMGPSKASQMLLFNHKMTAKEAKESGLVAEIYSKEELNSILWPQLIKYADDLPMKSLVYSKRLMRHFHKAQLHEANRVECERLKERFGSEDAMNAVMKFMASRKSKM